jgi:hypothetical protein
MSAPVMPPKNVVSFEHCKGHAKPFLLDLALYLLG